ncbi:glycine betaine ABC transporter substrate-binding protein [Xinfangfangia sp. CPCC 101601]|uniref:Glycine betaine ABC transporter substrate-binding protein n=1 Tax=Pseudogemmobacter lacusdianii TaxID=3069608 RepID=A0ABU0W0T4_9RHOB|nr:glycine betaine ABC transporter substrate-binding protein [Xinfangfangia sp. CPCC 101601]MDQ2067627.1 glycine betaine ABC transporter substrate-binding protein [Xinfangfangia sp. CPCC 101601]
MSCNLKTLAFLSLAVTTPMAAQAADVVIPDPNYISGRTTAFAVKAVIEEALGLEVEMITTTAVPVIFEAMARGNGEIDIWTETWLPNQSGMTTKYVDEEKTVSMSEKSFEALNGYCVTKVVAEEHGITSVFDLANPDNAALFDSNGDGKGEIWIGPQGWQSTNTETVRARDYGFADFFELQSTDEAVATAGLDRAAKANKPWVGYCYGPHQNFAMYDIVMLEEPAHDPANFVMVQPAEDPDWMAKSRVASAYADTTVHISWSSSLSERQPELVKLLQNIQLTAEDVNAWSLAVVNGEEPAAVTAAWVKANPELIASWMAE